MALERKTRARNGNVCFDYGKCTCATYIYYIPPVRLNSRIKTYAPFALPLRPPNTQAVLLSLAPRSRIQTPRTLLLMTVATIKTTQEHLPLQRTIGRSDPCLLLLLLLHILPVPRPALDLAGRDHLALERALARHHPRLLHLGPGPVGEVALVAEPDLLLLLPVAVEVLVAPAGQVRAAVLAVAVVAVQAVGDQHVARARVRAVVAQVVLGREVQVARARRGRQPRDRVVARRDAVVGLVRVRGRLERQVVGQLEVGQARAADVELAGVS